MENMLQANSAIQGVFAHNDEMALGAVEAVGNKKNPGGWFLMRQTMQSQQSKQEKWQQLWHRNRI